MNLYYLHQNENNSYDTYDSMVIAAESEEDAKYLSMIEACYLTDRLRSHQYERDVTIVWRGYHWNSYINASWSTNPTIELISESTNQPEGIVCSSFNAG